MQSSNRGSRGLTRSNGAMWTTIPFSPCIDGTGSVVGTRCLIRRTQALRKSGFFSISQSLDLSISRSLDLSISQSLNLSTSQSLSQTFPFSRAAKSTYIVYALLCPASPPSHSNMGLIDKLRAKYEVYRLEQYYVRGVKRRTLVSDAQYIDGEYIHAGRTGRTARSNRLGSSRFSQRIGRRRSRAIV